MLPSYFDKLLLAGETLANTFLPLTSVSHFVVLIDFLNNSVSGETLLLHL
jgi:hypothetical protein